jgi:GT2 family glycosyltransferase
VDSPAGRAVTAPRSSVAVICPFYGEREEGVQVLERLSRLSRTEADELVLVDNTPDGVLAALADEGGDVRIVFAPEEQSSYYARNVAAEAVANEWLLFVDADCSPRPSILDDYFAEPIPSDCGVVAGAIVGLASQTGLLARYARARGVLDQARLAHKERPFGATANLLVRKKAWASVGGFHEGIKSGGDVDFCWRIQDAGWTLLYREGPHVEHVHREHLRKLVQQYVRYGAGGAWLERRHHEAPRSSKHTALLIAAPALILGNLVAGRRERAAFRAVDMAIVLGNRLGRLLENRPARRVRGPQTDMDVALVAGVFEPAALEAVKSLERNGHRVWVEAAARSPRTSASSLRELEIAYLEDDGVLRRLLDLAWLVPRRPLATLRQACAGRNALSRLWQTASRARRLAGHKVLVIYCPTDEQWALTEARRLGGLLGIRSELLDH